MREDARQPQADKLGITLPEVSTTAFDDNSYTSVMTYHLSDSERLYAALSKNTFARKIRMDCGIGVVTMESGAMA